MGKQWILVLVGILILVGVLGLVSVVSIVYAENIPRLEDESMITPSEKISILNSLESSSKIDKEVLDKLKSDEKVKVIIVLNEDNLRGVEKTNSIKEKIKENQNLVLGSLNIRDFDLRYKYKTLNALAGEINVNALQILSRLSIVKEIKEDQVVHASLSESVPLINADDVWPAPPVGLGYTGQGQTVCVVDTGVDYTHPAIGSSSCQKYPEETLTTPVESPHDYPTNYNNMWTITKPGYSNIAVHFEEIGLEKAGYDYIEIMDGNNNVVQKIYSTKAWNPSCDNIYNIWSSQVEGDTIKIRLFSDESNNCYGFKIDKISDGTQWTNCGDFIGGHDFVNDDLDPIDDDGHGTHVAGIITSDDTTYKGVAPDAKIVAMKVLDSSGSGYDSDVAAGVEWCSENKNTYDISVISISLGWGGPYNIACDGVTLDTTAINNAFNKGIFISVASGNNGWTNGISSPACASGATSVGATTKADGIAGYSNRGSILDLLAPGGIWNLGSPPQSGPYTEIVSACARSGGSCITGLSPPNSGWDILPGSNLWIRKVGTSMSAPHVSGLAALMLQANPSLTPTQVEQAMKDTGVPISSWKRINAYAAVNAIVPSEFIDISFSDPSIDFGSLNPGVTNSPATGNPYQIIVNPITNVNVDIYQKGNNYVSTSDSITIDNMKWAETAGGTKTALTSTYASPVYSNVGIGNHDLYYWLNIPNGKTAEPYISTIYFSAVKHNDPAPLGSPAPQSQVIPNQITSAESETQTQPEGGASVIVLKNPKLK